MSGYIYYIGLVVVSVICGVKFIIFSPSRCDGGSCCLASSGFVSVRFVALTEAPLLLSLDVFVELSGFSLSPGFVSFFFHFILRFWNQVLTCASLRPRIWASLARLVESKYFCSENVFSRTRSCRSVKTVRDFRHFLPLGVRRLGFTRKYTGRLCKTSLLGSFAE